MGVEKISVSTILKQLDVSNGADDNRLIKI